ncbi:3-hydroxyacyl-[acyl-carrier-protein] dehydratase [Lysobacter enzymogenes]|uniref:3-hydroxyacyl-ACP dehydratase FabZ family protein n=1 Tax=Lysobacter enzymogenes TaxID=69 RepID=UPI00339A8A6B
MNFVVPADHPCLPGHFPGRPLVPGVVVLERVLQALRAQYGEPVGLRLPQVKFLQPLLPGETARIELEPIEPDRSASKPAGAARWRFRVHRGEELLASGELVADIAARGGQAPA